MRNEGEFNGHMMKSKECVKDGILWADLNMRLLWRRGECQSPLPSQSCGMILETWAQLVVILGSTLYWKNVFAAQLPASHASNIKLWCLLLNVGG